MKIWVELHFTDDELEQIFDEYTETTGNLPPGKNEKLYRDIIREYVDLAVRNQLRG